MLNSFQFISRFISLFRRDRITQIAPIDSHQVRSEATDTMYKNYVRTTIIRKIPTLHSAIRNMKILKGNVIRAYR